MTESAAGGGRRLLNATAVMASGTAVSRVLGFVRAMLIAFILGNLTTRADVFMLALTVPSSLYLLLAGGTLNNVLVPQIVRAVTHDADGGKAFVDRIMTGFLVLLGVLTVIFTVATPLVMTVYTKPSWRSAEMAEHWHSLLLMSYITMPQIFFYGVFFLIGQVLNAREKFGPMMWAPVLNNVVSIISLGLYVWLWGANTAKGLVFTDQQVWLLGLGSTAGIVIQTLALLPFLKRAGFSYRPRFDLKGTGLGRTFHVAKWMVGYVGLTSLAQVVVTNLASSGGVTAYQQAYLIWILPHSLLTVSLATAMLPSASSHALVGDLAGVAAETTRALRLALTFLVPASIAFVVLADPITRVPFGNGVGADDYHFVAWTLMAFGVGLVPYTIQYLYLRAFYALDNTRTPFLLQIWISGANAGLAIALVLSWDDPGTVAARLALSYSASYLLGAFLTHHALKRRLPELDGRAIWRYVVRLAIATAPAAGLAWVITWWFARYPSAWVRLAGLALAGLVAVLSFFFAAKRMGLPEATSLIGMLRRSKGDEGASDAAESIVADADAEEDDRSQPLAPAPDPDGVGVFVPVAAPPAPPSEVLDFPEPPPAAGDVTDGRVLGGRYRLEEQLAVRDRTETWRAHDTVLDRPVLVHLLAQTDPRTPELLRRAREAALATDSRFLRVLDVVDAESDPQPYLVYEYAAGQTLEKVLRGGPLTGVETAWIVREVADGLIGLHTQSHYHRHLNPATLLITASGNVKVLGFGVNEAINPSAAHLNGEAADVQALGQLLYACLVARWPGGDRFGLPAAPVVDGRWPPPSQVRTGVAPAVDQVVDRILSPTPRGRASRLVTAQEVTTQLSLVLGPMSAAHDLQARLHPAADADAPVPVSTVAPPMPTPAASRFHASQLADPDDPGEETAPFVAEALSHSETFTPVPPPPGAAPHSPAEAEPAQRSRRLPFLLGAIGLVLAVGIIAGLMVGGRPTAAPSPASVRELKVAKVADFDPKSDGGSGAENDKQAKLAIDGDADTRWRTERYRKVPAMGGLKPGVGLVLDLGASRDLTRVVLVLEGEGTSLEVRVPAKAGSSAPMKSISQWTQVAAAADAQGTLTLDLPQPTESRFLLVYLTSLPPAGDDYFRGGVAEVKVLGR